jgi:DinB superfamily
VTPEERSKKIESYGAAYQILVSAIDRFPREMWQFRPAPDRWTIHEIIVHITDSKANSYIRCRRLAGEPGSSVLGYDENRWARELRHNSYTFIRSLPDTVWSNSVYHSEDGEITMDDWLDTYARHIPEHLEQMQANYEDWSGRRRTG